MSEKKDNRQAIIDAALALFAEKGYAATSINAIAADAEVSKSNVFHYFETKEALYLEVLRQACSYSSELLTQAKLGEVQLTFDHLKPFLQQQLQSMFEHPQYSYLVLREIMLNEANIHQALAEQVFGGHFEQIVKMLEDGKQSQQLKADLDCELAAFALVGLNLHYFKSQTILQHLSSNPLFRDADAYSQQIYDLFLQGIAR